MASLVSFNGMINKSNRLSTLMCSGHGKDRRKAPQSTYRIMGRSYIGSIPVVFTRLLLAAHIETEGDVPGHGIQTRKGHI